MSREPELAEALSLRRRGRSEEAATLLAGLIARQPDSDELKATFAEVCGGVWFQSYDPLVKQALLACFAEPLKFDLLRLYTAWITTVFVDPACAGIHRVADQVELPEAAFFGWLDTEPREDLAFLNEPLFLEGLRLLLVVNPFMEELLTLLRKWLCLNAMRLAGQGGLGFYDKFLIALGEQCHFNEYVFAEGAAEQAAVADLVQGEIRSDGTARALFALVGCYRSLDAAFPAEHGRLLDLAAEGGRFAALVKAQLSDPQAERAIAADLRPFGGFENRVTRAVQSQYEANPYPRWISASRFPPIDERGAEVLAERSKPAEILIAGCGTGRQVLNTLVNFPAARVTAIDIGRASLAYAQRKVAEAGFAARVEFLQADILSMADWPGRFDIVECVGVLHHMEDPFQGWQVLTERLKPGGQFRVGLYSEAARADIVAGQALAKSLELQPTPQGIRDFRAQIFSRPHDDRLRASLLANADFFTMSSLRDLFFHAQEHRFDLSAIAKMLEQLGLHCTGFLLDDPAIAQRYDALFPHDPRRASLANWHAFERQFPTTFAGMYQFWCQKVA